MVDVNAMKNTDLAYATISGKKKSQFLPLDEAIASRAVFVIVSGSGGRTDGRADGNAFGAS